MAWWERCFIGGLGGTSAAVVKFLGQDYASLVAGRFNPDQVDLLLIGYIVLVPLLLFLGASLAAVSYEDNRIKLLAIGVAAPALITTFAGGEKSLRLTDLSPMAAAYAADSPSKQANDEGLPGKIVRGLGFALGVGRAPQRYWVVVGSFQNRETAEDFSRTIDFELKEQPSLANQGAFVGIQNPTSKVYPVIVGAYSPYAEAERLRTQVTALPTIRTLIAQNKSNTPYLSTGNTFRMQPDD
jgi:hypothetical protein